MKVLIKKLDKNAVIPFQKHVGEDACYDLIPVSCKYNPKYDRFEYGLGFATEFTPDWEAEIRPRSTNTKITILKFIIINTRACIIINVIII